MLYFYQKLGVITISQKIDDITERKRLLKVVEEVLPNNCGAIIRTSAAKKEKEKIETEIKELYNKWVEIKENSKNMDDHRCCPFIYFTVMVASSCYNYR